MKTKLAALVTAMSALAGTAGLVPTAMAATSQNSDVVVHSVLLRATPSWGAAGLERLQPGAHLSEEGRSGLWIHVQAPNGMAGYVVNDPYYVQTATTATKSALASTATSYGTAATTTTATTTATTTTATTTTPGPHSTSGSGLMTSPTMNFQLPPGVSLDPAVTSLAGVNASQQAKANAVLQIAASKLGTPYIWGHNEDRGQYGFDCSNFTAYVYHHALGYKMSGASQVQYHSVGWTVPVSSMRPGDLVIFDNGGHVGIYAGNGVMIQEGGGLGKVGYLKLTPGSYWYNHISAVRRMF
ncbi:C40 family peptidase [Alicyclobacillus curvatus]|nr:C40 family peptidase [Alicyclobacillus curvatus]